MLRHDWLAWQDLFSFPTPRLIPVLHGFACLYFSLAKECPYSILSISKARILMHQRWFAQPGSGSIEVKSLAFYTLCSLRALRILRASPPLSLLERNAAICLLWFRCRKRRRKCVKNSTQNGFSGLVAALQRSDYQLNLWQLLTDG